MKPKNGVYKSFKVGLYLYGVCPLVAGNNLWAIDVFLLSTTLLYIVWIYLSIKIIIIYSFIFMNKIITGTSSPGYAKKAVALQVFVCKTTAFHYKKL